MHQTLMESMQIPAILLTTALAKTYLAHLEQWLAGWQRFEWICMMESMQVPDNQAVLWGKSVHLSRIVCNKVEKVCNKVEKCAIKCYFITHFYAKNGAVKTN
jgi:hypothetical protein